MEGTSHTNFVPRPGWLNESFERARKEVDSWPEWLRERYMVEAQRYALSRDLDSEEGRGYASSDS